jgi:hypothetical protein
MEKTLKWLRDYGIALISILLVINLMQNCNQSKSIAKNTKAITVSTARVDSINCITTEEFAIMLQIEGLKSEKRMIQATDRRMLDVNRQTEIDNEIAKLNKELETVRQNKVVKKK